MKMKMVALITMAMMTLEPATCMTANYSFQWSYIHLYYYKRSGGTLAMSYTPGGGLVCAYFSLYRYAVATQYDGGLLLAIV